MGLTRILVFLFVKATFQIAAVFLTRNETEEKSIVITRVTDSVYSGLHVRRLSVHDRKLLLTDRGGGKQEVLAPSAGTKSSVQQSGSFVRIRVYSAVCVLCII